MANEAAEALGQLLGEQMEGLRATEQRTRDELAGASVQAKDLREQIIADVLKRSRQPSPLAFPEKVLAIANTLNRQPRLIDPVDTFLRHLVAQINAAVDKAIKDAVGDATAPPPPSGSA